MNTELLKGPKKKFSIGSIFCFITALAVIGFGLRSVISGALTVARNLATLIQDILSGKFMIADSVLLTNAIQGSASVLSSLISMSLAIVLTALGILLLLRANSRLTAVVFILPVAVAMLSLTVSFGGVVAGALAFLPTDPGMVLRLLASNGITGLISSIPTVFTLLCWVAIAVAVFILGGGKEYSKKRSGIAIAVGIGAALLFLLSAAISIAIVMTLNGFSLFNYISTTLANRATLNFLYLIRNFGSTLLSIANSCIIGGLLALTAFFSVSWLIAPFKKV